MNEAVSIFDVSNFLFLFIISMSWIFLNSYNAIFLKFRSNKERRKASKILLIIAIGSILYAMIWLSVLKNKLSLDDIGILSFFLKISFAILILGLYNFLVSIFANKKQKTNSNYDIDNDMDNNVYDDNDMNSNNNKDKHYKKDKEEEFEDRYDFDNNISDSIDSYDDD